MPDAFTTTQLSGLQEGLKALYNRVLSTNQLNLTHDEFYTLFVDPDVRYILKRAPEVGNCNYMTSVCACPWNVQVAATLAFNLLQTAGMAHSPLAPRNPELQPNAPSDLVTRVDDWVARRVQIGTDFSRANVVLEHLDTQCSSGSQVRYAWPSVVALARMNEATHKLAEQLAPFRQPRTIPPLTYEFRQALRKASATVSGALLLEDDIPQVPTEVTVVEVKGMAKVDEPGIGSFMPW